MTTTALVSAGVFLGTRELGIADQYASVGSFLVALVSLAVSIRALTRGVARHPADENPPRAAAWRAFILNLLNRTVVNEPHAPVYIDSPSPPPRRGNKPRGRRGAPRSSRKKRQ
ncbi:hypothetical protein [Micromonospora sp. NPDC049497]|uniref:hypothetical protein n=1 Tax=Micromonospora sp. NPDC049497 TaxID=3364273 RepID=UPI0037A3380A